MKNFLIFLLLLFGAQVFAQDYCVITLKNGKKYITDAEKLDSIGFSEIISVDSIDNINIKDIQQDSLISLLMEEARNHCDSIQIINRFIYSMSIVTKRIEYNDTNQDSLINFLVEETKNHCDSLYLLKEKTDSIKLLSKMVTDLELKVDNIENSKQDKLISGKNIKTINDQSLLPSKYSDTDNLIDATKLSDTNKGFDGNGYEVNTGVNYKTTDYIKVDGRDMICSNPLIIGTDWRPGVVYNENKTRLRVITSAQYTYQEGDYYVRWCVQPNNPHANYGTTLAPYTPYAELSMNINVLTEDTTLFTLDGVAIRSGASIQSANGVLNDNILENSATSSQAFNFRINDSRFVGGASFRLSFKSNNNELQYAKVACYIKINGSYTSIKAGYFYINSYGEDITLPDNFTDGGIMIQTLSATNVSVTLDTQIIFKNGLISVVADNAEDIKNATFNYITTFNKIAVIGDSYSSGMIYINQQDSGTRHNDVSWLKIMSRKNGVDGTLYSIPGINCHNWLNYESSFGDKETWDTYAYPKFIADSPSDLYFIFMGINSEELGSIADCNEDWSQNGDTFYGNYGKIIGNIKQHAPNAKIVCVSFYYISTEKNIAIWNIADFYGVACMHTEEDEYFKSSVYQSALTKGHPVAITYYGMANAFERCFSKCVEDNVDYFKSYLY